MRQEDEWIYPKLRLSAYNDGLTEDLIHEVGKILHVYNMLPRRGTLGVAVSGGADSVVLLHVLQSLTRGTGRQLIVLHVNHKLRGAESDADEAFVRELAASSGLAFLGFSEPLLKGNLEQAARQSRLRFFATCQEQHGIERIAVGHTRSDQAETVLLRLLRGSGLAGLAAMLPVTKTGLIRPLLFSRREQIRDFAREAKLTWREDLSNQELRFRRNRMRLLTLPQLNQEYNSNLEEVLARTAELAQAEESYWKRRIDRLGRLLVTPGPGGVIISANKLMLLHLAEQRRLLRSTIARLRKSLRSIDRSHVDAILRICRSDHGHDRIMIPGLDAIRSFETLLLTGPETMKQPRGFQIPVRPPITITLPFNAGSFSISEVNTGNANCVTVENTTGAWGEEDRAVSEVLGMSGLTDRFVLRNWEPGDTFHCPGSLRPQKIKTLFQESRIVLWERRHWPVLVVNGEVAWVRQFGIDARFLPLPGQTSFLQIDFKAVRQASDSR